MRVECTCPICGKHYSVPQCYVKRGQYKYCSNVCRGISQRGKPSPNNRGGKITTGGYRQVQAPSHPFADKRGYVMEHRLVVEQALGRYLDRAEIVHHINGDKLDNRPENLEIMSQSEHCGMHQRGLKKPRLQPGQWSMRYDRCQECGTTERPHEGHGYCHRCLVRLKYQAKQRVS